MNEKPFPAQCVILGLLAICVLIPISVFGQGYTQASQANIDFPEIDFYVRSQMEAWNIPARGLRFTASLL